MTGIVADKVYAKVMSPHYADHTGGDDWDIMSTGILSSEDFNAVLRGAKVVVNASRCEAGSGSGLDAWKVGVSVAMSNLPSFMQQMEFLKTKASLFDPMDAKDIARAVLEILDNPILAQKDAAESKAAMLKYTWDDVARQYMEIFKKGS
ncbi:hypothetical protein FACS1894139_15910 [Planctomycetales bacterium]|nr:hypothetical protein FACS1894107_13270 [Planctomycetales bacterium]GHT00410.1 hypothetical protein FACS1894108_12390 [Planctomycetales bacterium]GHT07501.1 hypothetical protein FACS1894139_15910 [Planctomycetales bacterium]